MISSQKNFLKGFARVSPCFVAAAFALLFASLPALAAILPGEAKEAPAADLTTNKREAAGDQFQKAEQLRETLNSKPVERRTLAEYKQTVSAYRRVYLLSPRFASVSEALFTVGELYKEMGDRFGQSYYRSAVDAYQFLLHEYPTSKHNQEATLRIAQLQKDYLNEPAQASRTYQDFLKKYPRSSNRREVQEAVAELALLLHSESTADAAAPEKPARKEATEEAAGGDERSAPTLPRDGGVPRVRRISTTATDSATRVTIDVEDSVQYISGRIKNPDRIFFDLHAAQLTPEVARGQIHVEGDLLKSVRVAQNKVGVVRVVLDVEGVRDYTASLLNNPTRLVIDLYATKKAMLAAKAEEKKAEREAATASRNSPSKPDLVNASSAPKPTRDGQSTLTRALGLKIGRIVIDAGHGGHDTGTIGPSGLMEKDLCLDVALRLGKIVQQRLPGADVVYTRSDDTFIPLEERTRIANEAKADLFISIHANSSRDKAARGIETYYLNLKGSADAMEVAARENAASQENIHDLEDLVKQIAQTEKIDESREFAEDVQDSLAKHLIKTSHALKNRGVRKAPFVVLIGADMPSILTEISFLSNPTDEKQLKRPEQRQRVAEGLYQGVANYLQSLNSMTLNMKPTPVAARRRSTLSAEESRNQK